MDAKRQTVKILTAVKRLIGPSYMPALCNVRVDSAGELFASAIEVNVSARVLGIPAGVYEINALLARVKADSGFAGCPGVPLDEMPGELQGNFSGVAPQTIGGLQGALKRTLPSASTDESRYPPSPLRFILLDPPGYAVAIDGHRLARVKLSGTLETPVMLPLDVAQLLAALAGEDAEARVYNPETGPIRIATADASGSDLVVTFQRSDVTFPSYRQVIPDPTTQTRRDVCSGADLAAALKRLAPAVKWKKGGTQTARMHVNGAITLKAENADYGSIEAVVPLPPSIGKEVAATFNIHYLIDGSDALAAKDKVITVGVGNDLTPLTLESEDALVLILPVAP